MQRLRITAVEGLRENPAWAEALKRGEEFIVAHQTTRSKPGLKHLCAETALADLNYWSGMQAMLIFLGKLPYNKDERGRD